MDYKKLSSELFFSKEAAEYLGVTVSRFNKLVQEKKIIPLKKNSSGAVFHVNELNRRKEELSIFDGEIKRSKEKTVFKIDTKTKQEALNFSVLMNVLNCTEAHLDPLFEQFSKEADVSLSLIDANIISEYGRYYGVSEDILRKEYIVAEKAFLSLRETDEIIKRGTDLYPPLLAQTDQAPRFLYVRGKKALLFEKRTVALVGSRQASEEAKNNTKRVAEMLGRNGITVISGLAKGIDVAAHKAALDMGCNTIAVIGTNLNQYYPSENRIVQEEIEKKGLVVSQFSPASKTQRWFFPLRNGVMSGLSLATVIMEAGETSGALKQADFALKQHRQVLIPASALKIKTITWPAKYQSRGAVVVNNPKEILERLTENNIFQVKNVNEQMVIDEFLKKDKSDHSSSIEWESM